MATIGLEPNTERIMNLRNITVYLVLLLVGSAASADSTMDQLVKLRFSGSAKIINVFGGKAAKDGLEMRTAVSGDRKATITGNDVEVIDLGEQMIWRYAVNRKGKAKKCRATTFDEYREQLAAIKDVPMLGGSQGGEEPAGDSAPEMQYEVTLNFRETGEQESHAGMTGDVYLFEAIAHRPGLPVEEGGGIVETTFVVGPKTDAWNEMQAWNMRWGEVIGEMMGMGANLGQLLAANPALAKVIAELRSKEAELNGTMLRTSMRLSTVPDPRMQQQKQADEGADGGDIPTSLGGLGAKLGGAFLKKKREESAPEGPQELYTSEVVTTGLSDQSDALLTLPDSCTK